MSAEQTCQCGGHIVPETNRGVEHLICTQCSHCAECDAIDTTDHPETNLYGFRWGNVEVTRMTDIAGRGKTLSVRPVGKSYGDGITVYVSEGGRSVRAFKGSRELR